MPEEQEDLESLTKELEQENPDMVFDVNPMQMQYE